MGFRKADGPKTGKRSWAQEGRKSRDQTVRQSEHVPNNLSDVQRVGDVYEKQAPMSHSLLSQDQSLVSESELKTSL